MIIQSDTSFAFDVFLVRDTREPVRERKKERERDQLRLLSKEIFKCISMVQMYLKKYLGMPYIMVHC